MRIGKSFTNVLPYEIRTVDGTPIFLFFFYCKTQISTVRLNTKLKGLVAFVYKNQCARAMQINLNKIWRFNIANNYQNQHLPVFDQPFEPKIKQRFLASTKTFDSKPMARCRLHSHLLLVFFCWDTSAKSVRLECFVFAPWCLKCSLNLVRRHCSSILSSYDISAALCPLGWSMYLF